jgi:hypothetical protein
MELIKYNKFIIEGLKDREVSLYRNNEIYEVHETESPIMVIGLGEKFGIDKFNEIVNGWRKAAISMKRNFKLITNKE